MSDAWILRHVGMDRDELLRLKQITGLAALFKDQEFSEAWTNEQMSQLMEDEGSKGSLDLADEATA